MELDMGFFGAGSAAVNGYPAAATPAAAGTSPAGPTTIGQKAFGIVTGSPGGPRTACWSLCVAGAASLAGLWYIWWSLPR
jgi:hypothetical protein